MDNTKELLKNIIEGIQDKKGSNLVVVDLTGIETSICQYFVICQGNSANQTTAIAKSVGDKLRENCATKPFADVLDETEEAVAAALERMLAGDIRPRPETPEACKWCPVSSCSERRG